MEGLKVLQAGSPQSKRIITKVQTSVRRWRKKAEALKISRTDQELKQTAFGQAERKL